MAVLVAGQDYVILILVCVITLVITGCSHAFVLTTNNNLQASFAKVGIYIGQFAVAVQVAVVIQRMDIEWQANRLQLRFGQWRLNFCAGVAFDWKYCFFGCLCVGVDVVGHFSSS